jgi:hypothetical protein
VWDSKEAELAAQAALFKDQLEAVLGEAAADAWPSVAGHTQQQQHGAGGGVESPPWRGPTAARPRPPASAPAFVYDVAAAGELDEEWLDDGDDGEELTL